MNESIRIVLHEPRIPQNTGNIGRTCAAFNIGLDIIKPTGFSMEDKYLKRAGLDYWKYLDLRIHENYELFKSSCISNRVIAFTKKRSIPIQDFIFRTGDRLLFGREDIGLPSEILTDCSAVVSIPMPGEADKDNLNGVRSLNLSVACGIAGFYALNSCE